MTPTFFQTPFRPGTPLTNHDPAGSSTEIPEPVASNSARRMYTNDFT
jgi:hypothetical protein